MRVADQFIFPSHGHREYGPHTPNDSKSKYYSQNVAQKAR